MSWSILGALTGLVVLGLGGHFWAMKWLLDRHTRHTDGRLEKLETATTARIDRIEERAATIERDFGQLRAELPARYVAREDWVRVITTFLHRLDRLADTIEALKEKVWNR